MDVRAAIRGFYAVLDRDDEALARLLLAHARVIQVRIKPAVAVTTRQLIDVGRMARRVTRELGAALVIDDRVDVAVAVAADGVHLGQTDLAIADARRIAPRLWIGVSTHDVAQVRAAVEAGADYLGFGPVFATATKHDPDPVQGLEGLVAAVAAARGVPIVAIGGITPAASAAVAGAGAAAACVISAVNAAADPGAAARQVAAAWAK